VSVLWLVTIDGFTIISTDVALANAPTLSVFAFQGINAVL
jgi:hypothetical protein